MWRFILFSIFLTNVLADDEKTRTVILSDGGVEGVKYWNGDFYEFYGVPYAEAPTGRDRYQAPLPVKPWNNIFQATSKKTVCYQSHYTDEDADFVLSGDYDCLVMNLLVPEVASEQNLVPVVVYVHSGAFSGGSGTMAMFHYLARHDILVISFNYRVGALGFACLGNKEIPGNAGLKDQVAALRWIKKNIKNFGGDPNKITLAGYSVGAAMAELLTLSKTTDGLINQLILESGSALSPFTVNRDPLSTAKNIAFAMGYNGTETLEDLTEFYLNVSVHSLAEKSINFFLPNSTFGYTPCIENVHEGIEPFLTESPLDILKRGDFNKIPILTGFSNMEGISRTIKFGEWRERMTEDFSDFIPADLKFNSEETKQAFIKEVKQRYFNGQEVNHEKLQGYINYFSDAMFKYSIMKSLKLHAAVTTKPIYFYEFSYVGKLNMNHNYMDKIKGASHRDQTAYILDFYGWTNNYRDLDMRDRMTTMWADFVKYGNPTAYESLIVNYQWLPYTNKNQNYLQIGKRQSMKQKLFVDEYNFWDKVYKKYHWKPEAPKKVVNEVNKEDNKVKQETVQEKKVVNEEKKEDNKAKQDTVQEKKVVNEVRKEDKKAKQETVQEKKVVNEVKKEANKAKQEAVQEKKVVNEVKNDKKKDDQDTVKVSKVLNESKKDNVKQKDVPQKKVVEDVKKDSKQEATKEKKTDEVKQQEKKK
ncbi:esterase E4-like [Epargyreus clarus]|uniref:esterase E4-like n=1 Tax=Epargyreus clarus TaxID=520877 RepID=UPI003C2B6983